MPTRELPDNDKQKETAADKQGESEEPIIEYLQTNKTTSIYIIAHINVFAKILDV
jgi:hypothetical protein